MNVETNGLTPVVTFSDGETLILPRTAAVEIEDTGSYGGPPVARARVSCTRCGARTAWRMYSEAAVKAYVHAAIDHARRCAEGADFHVAPDLEKPRRLAPVALPEVDAANVWQLIVRLGWPTPGNGHQSVSRFIQEGLDDSMLGYLVAVTHSRREVEEADKFRYFCGCAWKLIRGEVDTGYSRG